MRNTLLISVAAAAVIAGSGLASAQGTNEQGVKGGAAPAASEMKRGADVKGATETKAPDAAKRADEPGKGAKGAQAPTNDKAKSAQTPSSDKSKAARTPAADSQSKTNVETKTDAKSHTKAQSTASDKSKGMGSDAKVDSKASTTGQGKANAQGGANLTPEQRTKITTVIKQQNVRSVTNVNFSISVGTRVPRSVHFYSLPIQVVEVYPEWRGYKFILVNGEILVINPRTLEIVAVIAA
jgi:hypothetical protein